MRRRFWLVALLSSALLSGLLPASAAAADPPPLPNTMAAVGDSITQAASSGGGLGTDYPQNSWSTGTNATVNSHYLRLAALQPGISGQNHSVSGAKMFDLNGQMQQVVALQPDPDYVTVLIGGNDLCTDTATQMTEVSTFGLQFENAMTTLMAGSTTSVYVVSIPNAYHLWDLFRNNWWARFIWSVGNVCQSLLANPLSNDPADLARRAEVAKRNVDFNTELARVCALYPTRCRFDNNAVYNTKFAASDAAGDYFHPSISGQAKLAQVSWAVGYWPNAVPPTPIMHVATPLTYTRATTSKNWNATVTIRVVGPAGEAVVNATVSATWSRGAADTCVTTATGSCTVTSDWLSRRNISSVVITVANVTHDTYAWDNPNPKPSVPIARPL